MTYPSASTRFQSVATLSVQHDSVPCDSLPNQQRLGHQSSSTSSRSPGIWAKSAQISRGFCSAGAGFRRNWVMARLSRSGLGWHGARRRCHECACNNPQPTLLGVALPLPLPTCSCRSGRFTDVFGLHSASCGKASLLRWRGFVLRAHLSECAAKLALASVPANSARPRVGGCQRVDGGERCIRVAALRWCSVGGRRHTSAT